MTDIVKLDARHPARSPMREHTAATMRLVEWADEARAAHALAESLCKTPFAGQFKGDPIAGAAAILRGSELGLSPVTSLAAFDVIQGTVAPKALTLHAFALSHGHDVEVTEVTPERAVARYRRNGRGDWQTTEFTLEDARGLGLLGKDNWKKQPRTMLEARVKAKASRLVAPDVLLGIGYSSEELRDSPSPVEAPTQRVESVATVLAERDAVNTETGEIVPAHPSGGAPNTQREEEE